MPRVAEKGIYRPATLLLFSLAGKSLRHVICCCQFVSASSVTNKMLGETIKRSQRLSGLDKERTDMRFTLVAGLVGLFSCATSFAGTPSPNEIAKSLMTVRGHYVTYTSPDQVKTIKSALTPQLYSALLDWSSALQKTYNFAVAANNYDLQMSLPVSDNPFFGESDQTGDPVPIETISGNTATVVAKTITLDGDGKSLLRKVTNTFYFLKVKGKWLLSDVRRESSAFPDWRPIQTDLLAYLKEQTSIYKKQVAR